MNTFVKIFEYLIDLMQRMISVIITLALLLFLWGILMYFKNASSSEGRRSSVNYITYGLLSLFVITSVWGLVSLVGSTLGINQDTNGNFNQSISNPNPEEGFNPLLQEGNLPFVDESHRGTPSLDLEDDSLFEEILNNNQ
jgi:hypothetical protein